MEREVGGGIGMGDTCKPMAVSFQYMTKFTTNKKKIKKKKKKENYVLPSDIDSSQVAFNSINGLNWDLSLLVKRTRTQWKTMSSPDLVNLEN